MTRYVCLAALLFFSASAHANNWPGFRGDNGTGVAPAGRPPVAWDVKSSQNIAWKLPVPGLAHSSPIVWGDRVYVTTAVPLDAGAPDARHSWRLYAVDRGTGRVVWERVAVERVPRVRHHKKASHSSATPATDGRHIVALFGSEGLYCYDSSGKLLWSHDLGVLDVGFVGDPSDQWGPASSPVIAGNLVIVQNDRHKDSFVAAYDLATGKEMWRSARDEWPAWSTPAVRGTQVITNSPHFMRAHDLRSGKELWRIEDPEGQVKVVTPVVAGDLAILTGGYPLGGRPIVAVRPDGSVAWRHENGSPYTPTPLAYEGLLYVIRDNGVLTTYEVKTGQRIYEQRIAPDAGGFSASPVAADGKVYFASEDGDVFVVRAGRTFELLGRNTIGEMCLATPAISGDLLLVRGRSTLFAIRGGGSASN